MAYQLLILHLVIVQVQCRSATLQWKKYSFYFFSVCVRFVGKENNADLKMKNILRNYTCVVKKLYMCLGTDVTQLSEDLTSSNLRRVVIIISVLLTHRKEWPLFRHFLVWASLVTQLVKNLPAMQETQVHFLGQEDPLGKEMVTHSSMLAWKIPRTEEPGRLQSMGHKEQDTTERLHFRVHLVCSQEPSIFAYPQSSTLAHK